MARQPNAAWIIPTRLDSSASEMTFDTRPCPHGRAASDSAADFVWRVFRSRSPSPDDIRCAKRALTRCLQGSEGLGWPIWDQAAGWRGAGNTWSELLERDLRRLIEAHPPWTRPQGQVMSRTYVKTTRDTTVDQNLVAKMQSRIRQWLSKCYDAPQSDPRWKALVQRTGTDKAIRFEIMQKAKAARLVPEITLSMRDALEREPDSTQAEKTQEWRMRVQRLRAARKQKLHERGDARIAQPPLPIRICRHCGGDA